MTTDHWKDSQKRTFMNWINSKLDSIGHPHISDMYKNLRDGVIFNILVETITGTEINFNRKPHSKFQQIENIGIFLDFLENEHIRIINIRPNDIVEGNEKLTLGLVWILILKLNLRGLGTEDSEIKRAVLSWCRAVTADYDTVDIVDFSKSWKNGHAFYAILHNFNNKIGNYAKTVMHKKPEAILSEAFNFAEKEFNIPRLLDIDDLVLMPVPDTASVFTYVSEYYNRLKDLPQYEKETAITKENYLSLKNNYDEAVKDFKNTNRQIRKENESILNALKANLKQLVDLNSLHLENGFKYLRIANLFKNINMIHDTIELGEFNPKEKPEQLKTEIIIPTAEFSDQFKKIIEEMERTENIHLKKIYETENLFNELKITPEIIEKEKYEKIKGEMIEHLKIITDLKIFKNRENAKLKKAELMFKKSDKYNRGCILHLDYVNCCKVLNMPVNLTTDTILHREFMEEVRTSFNFRNEFISLEK